MELVKLMSYKFSAVLLLMFLSVSVSFGQDLKFELEIESEDTSIVRTESEIPVTVIITNKSEKVLSADGLGSVEFKFSKCIADADCGLTRKDFLTRIRIPRKKLFENESFKFQINLAEQIWYVSNSDAETPAPRVDFAKLPAENIYFTANIKMLTGYRNTANKSDNSKLRKRPSYKKTVSNVISVTID